MILRNLNKMMYIYLSYHYRILLKDRFVLHFIILVVLLCKYSIYYRFFGGDITKVKDDAALVKPTIFVGVPRLFNRIVEGVQKVFD